MGNVLSIIMIPILVIVSIFIFIARSGTRQGMLASIKNVISMSSIDTILLSLIVVTCICQILNSKIESYYEGMYAFNTEEDQEKLKDKSSMPFPYGANLLDEKVNLEGINIIKEKISLLKYACGALIFAVIIFRNYPLSSSKWPGKNEPQNLVKAAVASIGFIMLLLSIYIFNTSLSTLAEYNMTASEKAKQNTTIEVSGKDMTFSLPTSKEHLYIPLESISGWWYILLFFLVVGTASAFATLSANMSDEAFVTIKNKAALIKDIKHKGALVAFELSDPLFKLVDDAIAKKAKRNQQHPKFEDVTLPTGEVVKRLRIPKEVVSNKEGISIANQIPRLAREHPIKLFDFVKLKSWKVHKKVVGQPTIVKEAELSREDEQLYLVAAVDDWTILPESGSERKYAYLGSRPDGDDANVERLTGSTTETMYDVSVKQAAPVLAFSDDEMKIQTEGTVPYYLDPQNARFKIYGNKDVRFTPDSEEIGNPASTMGSINLNANKITLIPIDKDIFNISDRFADYSESSYEDLISNVTRLLQSQDKSNFNDIMNKLKNSKAKSLFDMVKNIVHKEFYKDLKLTDPRNISELNPVYLKPDGTPLAVYDEASGWQEIEPKMSKEIRKVISDRRGVIGRKYASLPLEATKRYFLSVVGTDSETKENTVEIQEQLIQPLRLTRDPRPAPVKMVLKLALLQKAPKIDVKLEDITLHKRIKENHRLDELTALDLINLRYSLIENLVFKEYADYKGQYPTELHLLYQNRKKHFPGTPGLLREILPALKDYVDPKTLKEYSDSVEIKQMGLDSSQVIDYDIKAFANRFNKFMGVTPNENLKGKTGIENPIHSLRTEDVQTTRRSRLGKKLHTRNPNTKK